VNANFQFSLSVSDILLPSSADEYIFGLEALSIKLSVSVEAGFGDYSVTAVAEGDDARLNPERTKDNTVDKDDSYIPLAGRRRRPSWILPRMDNSMIP
jgi:hypothetical protein